MRKTLLICSLIILISACAGDQNSTENGEGSARVGEEVFMKNCAICHGEDGRKGLTGAKIIPESELSKRQRIMLITQGKGKMMPYAGVLSKDEIEAVATYTTTLK